MELRQLRAFLEVANYRHFHHAAEALHLTQPALTQRIHALERELGVPLLERSPRDVRLTTAGELLLPFARTLVQVEDRALTGLKNLKAGLAGRLRIAYLPYGDLVLPGAIATEFRRRHPMIAVETSAGSTLPNFELLQSGEVDAAFAAMPREIPSWLAMKPLFRDHLVVAVSEHHPLANQDSVKVEELRTVPLVLFPPSLSPGFSRTVRRFLARHNSQEPHIAAEDPPDQALEAVARSRSWATLVSASRASSVPVPGIAYRRLVPTPFLDTGIVYVRDDPSVPLANFLRIADELRPPQPAGIPAGWEMLYVDKP